MEQNDFERLMTARVTAVPRKSLAEDIIHAALHQVRAVARPSFWQELLGSIILPHPSVAVTVLVLLGVTAGLQAANGLDTSLQDWTSFLDINDGGWL